MRIFAGVGFVVVLSTGFVAAQQSGGSLGLGVRICTAGTPQCVDSAKPKRNQAARLGFVPRVALTIPRYTCGAAAVSVAKAGYSIISRVDCRGGRFAYLASKGGGTFRIVVEAGSGKILSIKPAGRRRTGIA